MANCTGKPNKFLEDQIAATGEISEDIFQDILTRFKKKFGSPTMIANHLFTQLDAFPIMKGKPCTWGPQLEQLLNICNFIKYNSKYCPEFSQFDHANGTKVLRSKLHKVINDKWRSKGIKYEKRYDGIYPPFTYFVELLEDMCEEFSNLHFLDEDASEPIKSRSTFIT